MAIKRGHAGSIISSKPNKEGLEDRFVYWNIHKPEILNNKQ